MRRTNHYLILVVATSAGCLCGVASTGMQPPGVQVTISDLEEDLASGRGATLQSVLDHATHNGSELDALTRALLEIERRGRVPVRSMAGVRLWLAQTAVLKGRPEIARLAIAHSVDGWKAALRGSEDDGALRLQLASALLLADTIARNHRRPGAVDSAAYAEQALKETLRGFSQSDVQGDAILAQRAVRVAEQAARRLLAVGPSAGTAKAHLVRAIEAIEVLARIAPAPRSGPSAAERLLQEAVRAAARLEDGETLERCLAVPGRLENPWRPAAWYLTLVLADDGLYRSMTPQARDRLLEFCERWSRQHPGDRASLDLTYRVLVHRYLQNREASAYTALKDFWEHHGQAWLAGLEALHEDPVLAEWAALRWLAFGAARLGLVDDTQHWVRLAEQLARAHPSRGLRLDDLLQLPDQAAKVPPMGTHGPTSLLLRLMPDLWAAPPRFAPATRHIARLVLARNVLISSLSQRSNSGPREDTSTRLDVAAAVRAYDAAIQTHYCPVDPNENCGEPNNPDTDPNNCPLAIRNGWAPQVWRKWLAQPGFYTYVDADGNGILDEADVSAVNRWLEAELQAFDRRLRQARGGHRSP